MGFVLQGKCVNCTKSKCILREAPWSNLQNFDMQKIIGVFVMIFNDYVQNKVIQEIIALPRKPVDQVLKTCLGKPGPLPGIV